MKKHAILSQLDQSQIAASMFAMSMASDAQEAMARGDTQLANEILNNLKIVIDARLTVRDEHGRHAHFDDHAHLVCTGKKISFKSLQIGNPFYAHGQFWTRTAYGAGTSLASSGNRGPYGACDFDRLEEDQVEEVIYQQKVKDESGD